MKGKFFAPKDLLLIALLLVFAGVFYFMTLPGESGDIAEISVDGKVVRQVSLCGEDDGIHELDGVNITYEVSGGKIRFVSSDCPDKVCVNDGFIGLGGQSVVCLPNKTVISVPRSDDGDVDIMLH